MNRYISNIRKNMFSRKSTIVIISLAVLTPRYSSRLFIQRQGSRQCIFIVYTYGLFGVSTNAVGIKHTKSLNISCYLSIKVESTSSKEFNVFYFMISFHLKTCYNSTLKTKYLKHENRAYTTTNNYVSNLSVCHDGNGKF